jgi:hypothetical protein
MKPEQYLSVSFGLLFVRTALAADCSQKRGAGAPSGKDLGTLARSKLDAVCSTITGTTGPSLGNFPVAGYSFWYGNLNGVSTSPAFCNSAFDQIITQCVEKGDSYGGLFFFDGQVFNLTNAMGSKSPIGGNAVSNPGTPPPMPQQNGIPFYDGITCGFGSVSDVHAFGRTRWGEAGADAAVSDFNNQWKGGLKDDGLSYVQQLSHFWNGPEFWDCGVLQNQCGAGVPTCGDVNSRGANAHTVKNPAAWLILNSFTNIHNFYINQFNSFTNARGSLMSQMDDFSKTFNPVPGDDSTIIKLLLDGLTLGYGQLAAFGWNTVAKKILVNYDTFKEVGEGGKRIDKLNGDRSGWAKDGVNGFVTGMIGIGKDALPKAKTQLEATQHLDQLLGSMVDEFANTTVQYVESLFAGNDNAVSALSDTIANGKWIDVAFVSSQQLNNEETKQIASQVLYGQLIPAAWTGVGGLRPVVVFDDKICTDNAQGNDASRYISKNVSITCSLQR